MALEIFNSQVRLAATELVAQELQVFNQASNMTMVMGAALVIGDYIEEASWQLISGLQSRRNAYGTGSVASVELNQILDRKVKVDGRINPIKITPTLMKRINAGDAEIAAVIASQAAEAMLKDYVDTSLAALVAATKGQATLVKDASGAAGSPVNVTDRLLNRTTGLYGDRARQVACFAMHSTQFIEYIDSKLENTERLYELGSVQVYSALGRTIVVTDSPSLVDTTGGADLYHVLALTPAAVAVVTGGYDQVGEVKTGEENILRQIQGEYDFTLSLKGYRFKLSEAKSPTDAQLSTTSNWTFYNSSTKDAAAALLTVGEKA